MEAIPVEARREQGARWGLVTARDIMKTDVVVVHYATPLSEVERVLSENRISGAPVVDEAGHVIGVVSMKDLIEKYTEDPDARPHRVQGFYHVIGDEHFAEDFASFESPIESEETAQDVMTAQVHSVTADAGLKDIAHKMVEHRIHRLLVVDGGKHVGLISTLEILNALSA